MRSSDLKFHVSRGHEVFPSVVSTRAVFLNFKLTALKIIRKDTLEVKNKILITLNFSFPLVFQRTAGSSKQQTSVTADSKVSFHFLTLGGLGHQNVTELRSTWRA